MSDYLVNLYFDNKQFANAVESKVVHIPKNSVLIEKNTPVDYIYIILNGQVRVAFKSQKESINPALNILGAGEILGELTLFSDELASAQILTIDDSTMIQLDKKKVETFFNENPQEGYLLLKSLFLIIAERIRTSNEKINEIFTWGLTK